MTNIAVGVLVASALVVYIVLCMAASSYETRFVEDQLKCRDKEG